jgi:tetratricopeptide (TPR) repeat protein
MSLPPEIRVTIEKVGEKRYLSHVETSDGHEIMAPHTFEYDPGLLVNIEAQQWLEADVQRESGEEPGWLAEYGQKLYGYLFGDGLEFASYLRGWPEASDSWRLTLVLHPNAVALWGLPWEYLHDGKRPLALSNVWIQRLPRGMRPIEAQETPLPLRILVVVSSPLGAADLDTEKEIAVIQDALDPAVVEGQVELDFLESEVTLEALAAKVRAWPCHVIHYTGHGGRDGHTGETFLAMEDEEGKTAPASGAKLLRALRRARNLRLVVLSGCLTAQMAHRDALRGVATALLEGKIPAVLAMQYSVLDDSTTRFAKTFYTALGRGECPEAALYEARRDLSFARGDERADWGLPALYLRTPAMRLVDPTKKPEVITRVQRLDIGGLPLPRWFVGRKRELRQIRAALGDRRITAVYIRGIGGIGKSALAAKVLERPGAKVDDALVVKFNEISLPADILGKVASFWQGQGMRGHAEAAALLLDSAKPMTDRARQAGEMVATRHYLLVFDNFESLLTEGGQVEDPGLQSFFQALLGVQWRSTLLFTARFACDLFADRPAGTWVDVDLPGLTRRQALMLMNNLPRLRKEPLQDKLRAYDKVGGHPKTIELLEGYLADHSLKEVLENEEIQDQLTVEWERYFMGALRERLSADEEEKLAALCVFRGAFGTDIVAHVGGDNALVEKLRNLELMQREEDTPDGSARYSIHPVVQEYLLGRLTEAQREAHHLRAAEYYQGQILTPYRDQLRDQITADNETDIATKVLRQLAHQTQDMDLAHWAVDISLAWREHLFAARRYEEADDIVNAVSDVLNRWGQRDLAKALLRCSIATLEGRDKAVAQGNLATLLKDEGKLDETLVMYEDSYRTVESLDDEYNMAALLGQISIVHQLKGDYDRAIEAQKGSLDIDREIGNVEGQAASLHQLSILYRRKEDYDQALETSQEAEALGRRLHNDYVIAATLHGQGLILNKMGKPEEAFTRFQESLEISRRIGHEAGTADSLGEMGKLLLLAMGPVQKAIDCFTEFLEVNRRLGNPAKMVIGLQALGVIHEKQGQLAAALERHEQSLELARKYAPTEVARCERNVARVRGKLESRKGE